MEKVTSKDGTVIGFTRSGSGSPLILVHGTTANHKRWATVIPMFEHNYTVIAMDRRGRGGSGDSPDYDIIREAEDIAAIVDTFDEPVHLLGHSYGALCSLEAALLTNNINKLILYEAPVPTDIELYPPGTPERMKAHIEKGELEDALIIMMREVVQMPDHEFEKYRQLPMWKERIAIAPTIPREMEIEQNYTFNPQKFSDVTIPVLLLLGGDSPLLFQKATDIVDAALPNSRITIMPGQQHIAMDTNPDLFVNEVLDFLQE